MRTRVKSKSLRVTGPVLEGSTESQKFRGAVWPNLGFRVRLLETSESFLPFL